MKSINAYTEQEYEQQLKEYIEMVNKLNAYMSLLPCTLDELISYDKCGVYTHYTFSGYYTDHLIYALGHEPTHRELIMIVDGGFSHFGAKCNIDGYTFSGCINKD